MARRPTAVLRDELITLAHGAGGKATRDLVEALFLEELGNETLAALGDAAVVPGAGRLAMSTDAYVVHPLEFPGGDIGELAVNGTVNDLAMVGATTALADGRVRDRGGISGRRPATHRQLDGGRRPGGRGRDRRRRHEGRRTRQGRRPLRDDGRGRGGGRRRRSRAGACRARRSRPALRHARRSRDGRHGRPRRSPAGGRDRERHRRRARARGSARLPRVGAALDARSDARRARDRPQRACRGGGRSRSSSTRARCPSGPRSRPPARSSGSILSTWRTRAS